MCFPKLIYRQNLNELTLIHSHITSHSFFNNKRVEIKLESRRVLSLDLVKMLLGGRGVTPACNQLASSLLTQVGLNDINQSRRPDDYRRHYWLALDGRRLQEPEDLPR